MEEVTDLIAERATRPEGASTIEAASSWFSTQSRSGFQPLSSRRKSPASTLAKDLHLAVQNPPVAVLHTNSFVARRVAARGSVELFDVVDSAVRV